MATLGDILASSKTVLGLVRISPNSKAVYELLPLIKQLYLPLRPENEDKFSKEGNHALLKVPIFKRWQQGREGNI